MEENPYRNNGVDEFWKLVSEIPTSSYLDALNNARRHRHDIEGTLYSGVILRDVATGKTVFR